jgi:hypothetical protein
MILATQANYPNARTWVLKLHRDARPSAGVLFGRLENVTTGEQFAFASARELLACLTEQEKSRHVD